MCYNYIGILAGAWPCGTIALIAELFGSESKSQVYGSLHTFVQENHEATSDLCKCIQYSTYDLLLGVIYTFCIVL